MAIDILMPALSPTMESGTLSKWTIAVGDPVRSGDVIAEIETDKATMEVEAVDDGVLASILVADGSDGVAVGTVIARLAEDGNVMRDGLFWRVFTTIPDTNGRLRLVASAEGGTKTIELSPGDYFINCTFN